MRKTEQKQYYSYDGASSEVTHRAGSLEELLEKILKSAGKEWTRLKVSGWVKGDPSSEPLCFFVKSVHSADDSARQLKLATVQRAAKQLKILE